MHGDRAIPSNHDVFPFNFWEIYPTKRDLKYFLIGKVMLLMECESNCDNGSLSNPNLMMILEIYEFNVGSDAYNSAGRTGVLKVHKTLISCVSKSDHFVNNNATIKFRLEEIPTFCDYIPYHREVDVEKRIEECLQEMNMRKKEVKK